MKTLLRAAYAFPADAPLIRDAAVVFDGDRILTAGPTADVRRRHADARVEDLGDRLLLPGLVNPHTHLELSTCVSGTSHEGTFADWILALPKRLRRHELPPEEIFPGATRVGIEQCLRFGVTTVGDISQQSHLTRPILAASPLRCVSYGEVLGLGRLRPRFDELLPRALDTTHRSDRVYAGITPHAPYTVDLPGYRQCLALARQHKLPLATHLAESPHEEAFLTDHGGMFRELWDTLGLWCDPVETYPGPPLAFAQAVGFLDYPSLLAHVNYCTDGEIALLAAGRASVVYCPRTHAYFGHPPHRFRDMLRAGINVAVGSDSCASSPDLNLLDDLRLVHRLYPALSPEQLFSLVTTNAARALQLHEAVGSLAPGKKADVVAFPVRTGDPLGELLESDVRPDRLWIGGRSVL